MKKFIKMVLALMPFNRKYYCSVCNHKVNYFRGFGSEAEIFQNIKITGGGYRAKSQCPICYSIDRMRWLDYVLDRKLNFYEETQKTILHIAPEKCIEKKIRARFDNRNRYITGNIIKGAADEVVDITDMSYPAQYFDYIIINHVLEHVEKESQAMIEIQRTLKDTGKFIFSMPICDEQNTYETEEKNLSKEQRLQLYGQEDHVRLYGRDTKQHMEKYGFQIKEYRADECVSEKELQRAGYIREDRIFVAEKR